MKKVILLITILFNMSCSNIFYDTTGNIADYAAICEDCNRQYYTLYIYSCPECGSENFRRP